jgi:hypothetical protein
MAKGMYYVKAEFKTWINLTDAYSDEEKKDVIEAINYLPACEFELGIGSKSLILKGTGLYCQGEISSKEIGDVSEVSFNGWFCVDSKARRDKADEKLEQVLKGEEKLVFNSLSVCSFVFYSADNSGGKVENLPVVFEVTKIKPDGITFSR